MSALLALSEHRIAQETLHYEEIRAYEERWHRESRRRLLWLLARCSAVYGIGVLLVGASLAMTGHWAPIAVWGVLLLSNAGPAAFGYAFWMRAQGLWE
jgi:hypothetical protein